MMPAPAPGNLDIINPDKILAYIHQAIRHDLPALHCEENMRAAYAFPEIEFFKT